MDNLKDVGGETSGCPCGEDTLGRGRGLGSRLEEDGVSAKDGR
jgi:hypothetical protein